MSVYACMCACDYFFVGVLVNLYVCVSVFVWGSLFVGLNKCMRLCLSVSAYEDKFISK